MPIQAWLNQAREPGRWVDLTDSTNAPGNSKFVKCISFDLAGGNANAISGYVQNPDSVQALIVKCIANLTVAGGTGAGELNIGTAADATTGSDNLMDGLDANTTGIFDNEVNNGTNGKGAQLWAAAGGAADYITAQILLQNETSLDGTVYVFYIPLT